MEAKNVCGAQRSVSGTLPRCRDLQGITSVENGKGSELLL